MSVKLGMIERRLALRIQITILILAEYLQNNHLIQREEKGYDEAGELRFGESGYVWKIGRRNGMQDIYFVLESTPNPEDQQTKKVLYHTLQNRVPEEGHVWEIDWALPILTKILVARYPELKVPVDDLLSLIS